MNFKLKILNLETLVQTKLYTILYFKNIEINIGDFIDVFRFRIVLI